ncbi:hypothetical protein GGF32_009809 [Allomyces javanicus]|nr:hypothetical protein GGF32_009809 [Allomyces javanicus]
MHRVAQVSRHLFPAATAAAGATFRLVVRTAPFRTIMASSIPAAEKEDALRVFRDMIVPRLDPAMHKGQCGRVAVIGGCEEYTGAPYFSATASLKLGVDLSHVICDANAGTVIKSYSPELIVHPYLRTEDSVAHRPASTPDIVHRVTSQLDRFHAIVVGPGLGRDPLILNLLSLILPEIRSRSLPLVLDADALHLVATRPDLIRGYPRAVLTPNIVEYARLCRALDLDPSVATPHEVGEALGGVTVVRKGATDMVARPGAESVVVDDQGGLRRFGGQGDVLTGAMAAFLAWNELAINAHDGEDRRDRWTVSACVAACTVTRTASRIAYEVGGRGTTTGDVLAVLPRAFTEVVGEV